MNSSSPVESKHSPVVIVGVPYDLDSSFLRGCSLAPGAIREAFHSRSSNYFTENEVNLENHPLVRDAGDLELTSEVNVRSQIEVAIAGFVSGGERVLSLGGDHSITYPILKGFAHKYKSLNVIQFDAHSDLYDELDGNRYSHACPFARSLEDGIITRLIQVGIRTITKHQREQAQRFGVEVFTMSELNMVDLEIDGPVYITVDMDVLDPAFAPGISHYEPGGMSVRDVLSLLSYVRAPVVGADIVELNPTRDIQNMTAMVAAKFMKELLAKMVQSFD